MPKLKLHVAPVLLGGGVRLFDGSVPDAARALERTRVIESPTGVTHVTARAASGPPVAKYLSGRRRDRRAAPRARSILSRNGSRDQLLH